MPRKFVDQRRFHQLARRGDEDGAVVERPARVLRTSEESRTVRFVLSDGTVDRVGDTLDPNGWDLTAYKRNPVVLWGHDALSPPIGRMTNIFSDGSRLLGDVRFAEPNVYEFADQIFRLIRAGYINAGSVGFIPIDYSFNDGRRGGIDFHEQELLEFSVVPIPANSNALVQAAAKGLINYRDIAPLKKGQVRPRAAPAPSTLGYCGTLQQRQALLHWEHPEIELDAAVSAADPRTPEGRRAIAAAHRRFCERTMRR
jgi:HK97 family phage prohead protease